MVFVEKGVVSGVVGQTLGSIHALIVVSKGVVLKSAVLVNVLVHVVLHHCHCQHTLVRPLLRIHRKSYLNIWSPFIFRFLFFGQLNIF